MAGNKSDIPTPDPPEGRQTGISREVTGPGIFFRAGPLGLPASSRDPHPLAPAGRHQLASTPDPEDASDVALQFGPHAMHPILSAYTLRVITSILRAAVQPHALISSTARTLADEARVAYLYLKKQDFSGPKRRDALKDPIAAVFILALEGKESPEDIIDGLEEKLAELGPSYAGKFRPTDALTDCVNIEPDSLGSPDEFAKYVARDTRVINFLAPPLPPLPPRNPPAPRRRHHQGWRRLRPRSPAPAPQTQVQNLDRIPHRRGRHR
jgi:hypothetical protein